MLPHAFISPPRKIGTYVISHCLNTGEFLFYCQSRCLCKKWVVYFEDVESDVSEGRDNVNIEGDLWLCHFG